MRRLPLPVVNRDPATRPTGARPRSGPLQKQPQPKAGAVGPGLLTPAGYHPIIRRQATTVNLPWSRQ